MLASSFEVGSLRLWGRISIRFRYSFRFGAGRRPSTLKSILLTASGRIRCRRCTAQSTRSGRQCARPALKTSQTQKCQFHGGRGSGPKTAEGRRRIAAVHTVHGRDTKVARADRSAAAARVRRLVDAAYLLGMIQGPRPPGRKAAGYLPVRTLEDLRQMVRDDVAVAARALPEREG